MVANRSALSVQPGSDLGELYCRSVLVLVTAAAAGLAGAGAACSPRGPEFLTLELGGGKCSETGFFFMSISPGTLHKTVVREI